MASSITLMKTALCTQVGLLGAMMVLGATLAPMV